MQGQLQVPGFTVGRRLGEVDSPNWLAVHDVSGAPVTLRVVSGAALEVRPRLLAAIDVLRELDHPHVLRYQDMIERPDDVVIVLEAADGGSLSDLLKARGTLPPGEVVTACAPIAEGLAEMHQHGIVHGAVTSDDVVFAADGRPMLAGVGLGVLGVWPAAGSSATCPETVVGAPAEPPADVYSLAFVTCLALSGYQPREPLNIVGVPGSTLGVLSRSLQRTPDHRPEVGVLANAIYGIAAPEPVDLVPEQVEATSTLPRIAPEAPAEADAGVASDPDPDNEADIESFMRGGAGGRRARRPAGRRDDTAHGETAHGETAHGAAAPDVAHPGDTAPGATADQDPDSTVTRPIAAPAGTGSTMAPDTAPGSGTSGASAGASAAAPPDATGHDDSATAVRSGGGRRRSASGGDGRTGSGGRGAGGDGGGSRSRSSGSGGRGPAGSFDMAKAAIAAVVVLLVGAAVIVGMQIFGGEDDLPDPTTGETGATVEPTDMCGGPQPAPTEAPPAVTDWVQEIQRLHELRTRAFAELDATLLCEVYQPSSESLARDVELLQTYADAGVRPEGLAFEVVDVTLVQENGGTVTVEITDQITAHDLVDEDGDVEVEKAAVEAATWQADLVAVAGPDGAPPTWRFD